MSALGQKQTLRPEISMSALPPKADIGERNWDVRFVILSDDYAEPLKLPAFRRTARLRLAAGLAFFGNSLSGVVRRRKAADST